MSLRTLYKIDGAIMLAVGLVFWGCWPFALRLLGIEVPNWNDATFNFWKAISLGGTFGGALMAFGFAALAVGRSRDREFLQSSSGYFLAGHGFLAFIVFAKTYALWETVPSFLLLDLVFFPLLGFLYFRIVAARAARGPNPPPRSEREIAIREAAGQEERTRLAQDLHDSVKQQIYSIQANLAAVEARFGADQDGARRALEESRNLARDAMAEMIALLDRLRRDPIESVGLVEALRRQCEALGYQTGAKVITNFGDLPSGERLPPAAMKSVFRIAQEALANIARHARAANVQVEAAVDSKDTEFVLRIHDDGQGFDPGAASGGMGLANMRARAAEIGARLELRSRPGQGVDASLHVPLLEPRELQRKRHRLLVTALIPPAITLMWLVLPVPRWWRLSDAVVVILLLLFSAFEIWAVSRIQKLR